MALEDLMESLLMSDDDMKADAEEWAGNQPDFKGRVSNDNGIQREDGWFDQELSRIHASEDFDDEDEEKEYVSMEKNALNWARKLTGGTDED